MRIVHKTTVKKTGGKSHKKVKRKQYEATKTAAVGKVMENIIGQAQRMEAEVIRQAVSDHLGRPMERGETSKVTQKKTDKGYILCFDGVELGLLERQHAKDKAEENNYRVLFTAQ